MATLNTNRGKKPARPLTQEVAQFLHFHREGDIIPHGWNKKIGEWHVTTSKKTGAQKKVWRSRPFAERLLARIVWFYTPSPIKNDSGAVIGWQRKFKANYWQMNSVEMAQALGCSVRTIRAEIALLKKLGVITTKSSLISKPDSKKRVPLYVIPVFDAIVNLSKPSSEDSSYPSSEDSSPADRKNLPSTSYPPPSDTSGTPANAEGDDGTSDQPQGDTQPLEESPVDKKAAVPPPAAPARAPAPPQPPTRTPDPEQVRQADDLIQRYADHKQGGKLANWPITRRAIDKAVKNGAQEDKAAINAACDELKEVVSGIANAFGWRHWFDRKSALLIISLDLPLDTIRAYVQADCDSMAVKQKDREGYGMGDALQACRLGMAAHAQEQKKPQGPIAMRAPDGRPVMIDRDEIDLALAKGYTHV